ncbi:restriction endonuclease subunit S [Paraglaciecola sp.]|uniref:restriction endonuclease subunit S n=1 Tax=Paraglaciecola sp. TaxID=1920173 RepID=UPI003266BAD8
MKFVKLNDCCEIKPPKSEAKKVLSPTDLVSFVPMKNLGINTVDLELDENKQLSKVSGSYTYFAENDVLLAKITPCFENGKLGIARGLTNGIGFGSSEFIVFRPSKELLAEYLYYFLLRPKFREQGKAVMTGAVGHKRVPKDYIESTLIPLPSIEGQKRIVSILDQVFADIEKAHATAETNLRNARELFDSYLQQVFSQRGEGWVDTSLGNICNFQNGYAFKSKDTVETSNTQLLRMGNLYQNILDLNRKSVYYPDNFSDEYEQFKLKEGDMIISLTGTVGKEDYGYTVEIPKTDKTLLLNQRIAKITSIDMKKLDKRFLLRILRSRVFLDKLYSTANGTRQANLSTTTMKDILIGIPSLDKQLELCRDFDKLEVEALKLARIYSKKLVDLDELKSSILQKAFTGELTKSKGIVA